MRKRFPTMATLAPALVLALGLLAGAAHADRAKQWTVVQLTADSTGGGLARDVNNHGDVVGHTFVQTGPLPFGFTPHAFLWRNGARQDIGSPAGKSSVALSINDRGTIVGQVDGHGFMWKDGQASSLGFAGSAVAVNKRDEIVGTYWTGGAIGSGQERAFLMRDGVLFDLPTLNNGAGNAANDINDDGTVTGFSTIPFTSNEHAVVWRGLALRDLGTLGGLESFGNRINNHGVVVGTSQDASGGRFMARWNANGGPPEKLAASFVPAGINDHGAIVGNDVGSGMPFLFEDGAVTNLLELPAMKAGGWTAFAPMAINDHGWIVGSAFKPGTAFFGTALLLVPKS